MLLARFYLERITFSTSRNAEKTSLEERRQPKKKMNRWRELTFLFFRISAPFNTHQGIDITSKREK